MTFLDGHLPDSRSYLPVARMLGDKKRGFSNYQMSLWRSVLVSLLLRVAPTQNLDVGFIYNVSRFGGGLSMANYYSEKVHEQYSGRHYATLTHRCQRPSLANEKVALDAICTVEVVSDVRRGVGEEAS